MTNFRNYLSGYIDSENFKSLSAMANRIKDNLEGIRYNLRIKGDTINVEHHADEINYSDKIINVFSKFKQRDVTVKLDFKSHDTVMTNVEARILECVARLFPSVFSELDTFIETRSDYQSHTLNIFEREIQFYLASIEYFRNFQNAGLSFCIPEINVNNKNITVTNGFDLALAYSLLKKKENVVCNDFQLRECERILVVSGPNQGGKTTFARMIGQLHYLALLGLY
ncbi:TPA: DNA mismatch repair protein MutS, partial [Klebsiella pneumoniae]|nr:DNA mismatch repair protein MutS [Klebsiella pneumoniae]